LLAFVGRHAVPALEAWDGSAWTSSALFPGGPGVLQVSVSAPGPGVDVLLWLADRADEAAALATLVALLDLDRDVAQADLLLAGDSVLGPLVARRPGLRVPGVVDAFEALVGTIIGQQISVSGARTVTARLVQASGQALPRALQVHPAVTHLFPQPGVLARLGPEDDALAMPRSRARAVVAAAEVFAQLAPGSPLPTRAELLALPGVGPWTADYLDLRARRDADVLMPGDLAVRKMLGAPGSLASVAQVVAMGEAWRPFRSTALMHLWAEYLHL
jgi:AraC family transcriptional regulator of adaptative response / DNA-3-methyladenine glycosylase II